MTKMANLTLRESNQIEAQVAASIRSKLDLKKPRPELYSTSTSRASQLITTTLLWSKLFVFVIAIFAAIASSIRTVQAASEIYTAAGSSTLGVILAAISFTVAVEGALFTLAIAEEGARLKKQSEGKQEQIFTLRTFLNGILVRLGVRTPETDHSSGGSMKPVMLIAFAFAVIANAYMGFRPLVSEIGNVSLQEFFAKLWVSPARLQLTFLLDLAGILFPPFMALAAGHLTARFGAEIAIQSQSANAAYEIDFAQWRSQYTDPLNTAEGQQLLQQQFQERIQAKGEKTQRGVEINVFLPRQNKQVAD